MPSITQRSSSFCDKKSENLEKMRLVWVPGTLKVMVPLSRATSCKEDAFRGLPSIQQTFALSVTTSSLLTPSL